MRSSRTLRYIMRSPWVWFTLLLLTVPTLGQPPGTRQVEGLRDKTPSVHALTGLRVVYAPGKVIEKATIVIRDGAIEAVGETVVVPADAKVWPLEGKTAYAGLIDAYSETEVAWQNDRGAPYWNEQVRPQLSVAEAYQPDAAANERLRKQGIAVRLLAPASGVIKGTSALVTTGTGSAPASIIQDDIAQHMRLTLARRGRDNYPSSPMGAVALARQAMYDAAWHAQVSSLHESGRLALRPERNDALEKLATYSHSDELVIFDAANELFCLRAAEFAREFSLRMALLGSGNEYRRLDAIRDLNCLLIVPVDFPRPPNVSSVEAAMNASLEEMMHWDHAPENPARLVQAGVTIAFTTDGLQDVNSFLSGVRKAVARGLSPDDALRALTTAPAAAFGVQEKLGTIEAGKAAHLVITDGDLFASKTKILETWVDGQRFAFDEPPPVDVRGHWESALPVGDQSRTVRLEIGGTPARLSGTLKILPHADSDKEIAINLSQVGLEDGRFGCLFPAKEFGREGTAQWSAVLIASQQEQPEWIGTVVWPDGSRADANARRVAAHEKSSDTSEAEKDASDKKEESSDEKEKENTAGEPASFAVTYPLGEFGRELLPEQRGPVLFTGATVWTCGPQGVLRNASVLIDGGKIVEVGRDIATPPGAMVIDAKGKHISPGIIDCHSHMATDGGVNESSQAVTAEVRIGDFINCDDLSIYQQLAGGVTCANILHGSANPIGGQNQVIKLRWGMLFDAMKFHEAPQGIKFALGENVKQSNWGDEYNSRYPQTRMGVEQIIRDEFLAAREYRQAWEAWNRSPQGLPPRRDLELDAIAEVLEGTRWIHCHSYRQDEILAFLRVLESFDVTIGTLQHILEGYKVADAMAAHGAMGSAFSDWWAYKFEVYDAIPYNGALMHNAGVVVSFNSDDRELARHLNHEAAKAVKYGGVPPAEALKFVTLNPARQLRIEQYVGSLEPGKHADLVVWSDSPLSTFSRCEQTWIDGRKYFDIDEDRGGREELSARRATLIQKILKSGQAAREPGEGRRNPALLWPNEDEYCHLHDHPHREFEHESHDEQQHDE